ncbi:MAG: zinc-dependent metalloprotease [Acidimicrobiia bacterium]|nr:zinc-dependent metalloprotease [Acidimicrobiia bacterium]
MSGFGPFGAGDPFGGMPFFADLAKMLSQQGPVSWDAARQLAMSIATGGESEPNVDPMDRIQLEQLARVADLHVGSTTGLSTAHSGGTPSIVPVTRTQWVTESLKVYQPLVESIASALGGRDSAPGASGTDPVVQLSADPTADPDAAVEAWLGGMMQMLAPMMLGMTAGSMVGHLSARSFGQYDLPVPRPGSDEILVVVRNLDEWGDEWSLPRDELRLWVCLHEIAHHAVLGVPHVQARLTELLTAFVSAFEPDSGVLEDRIGGLDPSDPHGLMSVQSMFGDPEVILGAVRSPAQDEMLPRIEALVAVIVGYVDWVMDSVGGRLMGRYDQITEALRRRRVETTPADRFVGQMLGLDLTQAHYDRGETFISGIVERVGGDGLDRLWKSEWELPTPNEVDAPGLWLARIDLPDAT